MRILICDDPREAGEAGAARIGAALQARDEPVLGVATGSSPLPVYRALAEGVGLAGVDVRAVRAFALDEYVGIDPAHPERYAHVVRREVTDRLGLDPSRVHVPDGTAADPDAEAARYEAAIRDAGGVDAQILGLGANGHIGFNEPGSALDSRTRVVTLAPQTRAANARFFAGPELVPTTAITQGIGTILRARRIVLMARGSAKAEAVRAVVEGEVSTAWPGSALQRHPDVTLVLDDEAASLLARAVRRRALESSRA